MRETRDRALSLPAVLGDEAVGAVRAGEDVQGAAGVIVASVVADSDGRSHAGEAENGSRDGGEELHGVGVGFGD